MKIENNKQYIFNTVQSDLKKYNNTKVRVIRPLTETEADLEDVGPMYKVQYHDGYIGDVFEDELSKINPINHLLTEDEQKNVNMVEYSIIDKSGEVIWVLNNKGAKWIFSDQDYDEKNDIWHTECVPFKKYHHYLVLPNTNNNSNYVCYAWYGPNESYISEVNNLQEAINWLIDKE